MAGSIKWHVYTDDNGALYALSADESNIEAINEDGDYTGNPVLVDAVPRNVRPRFAVYGTTDGTRTIRIPVLTQAALITLPTEVPNIPDPINPALTLVLIRIRPEQRRLPIPNDTGLQDGDIS
jgi:hypothetical protein